jgi:protocatechuate 4,5-dioxygenase beta chain
MAHIVGAVTTSHVPGIGRAIALGLQQEAYWKPFFDGFKPVHEWLKQVRPDIVVTIYNDHGLNFFMDKLPTFAVGSAADYRNADEGWGIPTMPAFQGYPELSWHIIESLVADEFDITMCQEMLVDHAFCIPMALLWPSQKWPVRVVPVAINTVQFPMPSPRRCYKLGQALGRAIESWPSDARVLILGTGGLSHQLDGKRAGFINRTFDLMCMETIVSDPATLTGFTIPELAEEAGAQGVELIMWLAARGALSGSVTKVHSNYHVPISNTATGLLVLENGVKTASFERVREDQSPV